MLGFVPHPNLRAVVPEADLMIGRSLTHFAYSLNFNHHHSYKREHRTRSC